MLKLTFLVGTKVTSVMENWLRKLERIIFCNHIYFTDVTSVSTKYGCIYIVV